MDYQGISIIFIKKIIMLKSYHCVTYNFKTRDDGRVIFLRLILHTDHTTIHNCNSKIIIAIMNNYDFINYDLHYLSAAHLDSCSAEDKINRYGYNYALKSNHITISLQHATVEAKTIHPYFQFIEDTFNTIEEYEIISNTNLVEITDFKAVEITQKFALKRTIFPTIELMTLKTE
jgi:hypothetical protein